MIYCSRDYYGSPLPGSVRLLTEESHYKRDERYAWLSGLWVECENYERYAWLSGLWVECENLFRTNTMYMV